MCSWLHVSFVLNRCAHPGEECFQTKLSANFHLKVKQKSTKQTPKQTLNTEHQPPTTTTTTRIPKHARSRPHLSFISIPINEHCCIRLCSQLYHRSLLYCSGCIKEFFFYSSPMFVDIVQW